jgi:predicted nucleotidyltransferase component of viral defense system
MHFEVLDETGQQLFTALSPFGEKFYLAGGTALALQIGHRRSDDFDLFCGDTLEHTLLDEVKKILRGRELALVRVNADELTLFVESRKITFLVYPFPLLFPLVGSAGIPLMSVRDILATKAYTIGRRGSFKDYVDMYTGLREGYASLEDVIQMAKQKYGGEFNGRLFLEQLVCLDDIEDTNILTLKGTVSKETILLFFEERIRHIQL